jgi:hypothetical protein
MRLPAGITQELWKRWDEAALARGMSLEELVIACVERELARERFRRSAYRENGGPRPPRKVAVR